MKTLIVIITVLLSALCCQAQTFIAKDHYHVYKGEKFKLDLDWPITKATIDDQYIYVDGNYGEFILNMIDEKTVITESIGLTELEGLYTLFAVFSEQKTIVVLNVDKDKGLVITHLIILLDVYDGMLSVTEF
jgi:hypothetical protein